MLLKNADRLLQSRSHEVFTQLGPQCHIIDSSQMMQHVNSAEVGSQTYKNNAQTCNEVNFQYIVGPNTQHLGHIFLKIIRDLGGNFQSYESLL